MDTFSSFVKENLDLISLFLGLVSVVIALISVVYELRERKRKKEGRLQAQPCKKEEVKKEKEKETAKNERKHPVKGSKG